VINLPKDNIPIAVIKLPDGTEIPVYLSQDWSRVLNDLVRVVNAL
jgi:hypothetical protein